LVVLLRNYVTMMHGQQNIKNGWATIVVVGRLRVKDVSRFFLSAEKLCIGGLRQIAVRWPKCYTFIHLAVCLTTGPKPLPKPALHIVRSTASSFRWQCPHLSLRSSSSFLRFLPRLPVAFIPPFIFPSITCRRRQFLRKMWHPVSLPFTYFM
jgi:hypothetical protein